MKQRRDYLTSVAFTEQEGERLKELASRREWTISKTIREAVRLAVAFAESDNTGRAA
jgi:hypothetical protein